MLNFVQLGFVEVVTASTDKYQVLVFCPNWICKAQTNTVFLQLFAWQAQRAQVFREQQEELRWRHIDELRSKDMDRRAQVCQIPERRF